MRYRILIREEAGEDGEQGISLYRPEILLRFRGVRGEGTGSLCHEACGGRSLPDGKNDLFGSDSRHEDPGGEKPVPGVRDTAGY